MTSLWPTSMGWCAHHPEVAWYYTFRGLVRWIDGKNMAAAKADLDRAVELDPREWSFHACRSVLQYRQTEYARCLGSMVRCGLALRRTEFKYSWKLEYEGNGHGHFGVAVYWDCEGSDQKPDDGARPGDPDHRFVDMGLKALWTVWTNSLK